MKKIVLFSFAAILVYSAVFLGCKAKTSTAGTGADSSKAATPAMSSADRGKYLVTIASCNDCHTPKKMGAMGPEMDYSHTLSGHPGDMKLPPPPKLDMPWAASTDWTLTTWSGPWGISYSANLTPDSATGLGKWDETTFMLAIRNGKHIGTGRPILPPMPWELIKQMTDEDLKAVYAYLRTIPAIHNQVPEAVVAPPPPMAAGGDMKKK
jgi:mono/diheme cytochrome c family protein